MTAFCRDRKSDPEGGPLLSEAGGIICAFALCVIAAISVCERKEERDKSKAGKQQEEFLSANTPSTVWMKYMNPNILPSKNERSRRKLACFVPLPASCLEGTPLNRLETITCVAATENAFNDELKLS